MVPREAVAYYRQSAARCVEIANESQDPTRRADLLNMARVWLILADLAEQDDEPPCRVVQQRPQSDESDKE